MAAGDHLVVRYGFYFHHGVDLGNGFIVHFGSGLRDKRRAKVEITAFDRFSNGQPVVIHPKSAYYTAEEIINRAKSRLGETAYDVCENNCEHFVHWCRYGVSVSPQIGRWDATARRLLSGSFKVALKKIGSRLPGRSLVRGPSLAASWGADLVQWAGEFGLSNSGRSHAEIRRLGKRLGAVTATGLGWYLGGPRLAATSLATWALGENTAQAVTESAKSAVRRWTKNR